MDSLAVKQLDHVIARVDDAPSLHALFSETFQLPVSWPVRALAAFTSGGISLGNTILEILSIGENVGLQDKAGAHFCGFAFECDSIEETVRELKRRGLRCSSVVPYVESPSEGEPVARLWSNAFLDGLAGTDFWTRYIIFSTAMPGYTFWANLLRGTKIERAGISRLFSGTLVFLVEYEYRNFKNMPMWSDFRNHDEKRAAESNALRAVRGGPLGLESVKQIVLGVKDYEGANRNWKRLLSPTKAVADGLWEIADGPAVRLVPSERDMIQALVLKVSETERAKTFLREKGMLESTSGGQIRIDPAAIHGLDIRLV